MKFLKSIGSVLVIGFYILAGSLLGYVIGGLLTPHQDGSTIQKIFSFAGFFLGLGLGIMVARRTVGRQKLEFFQDRTGDFTTKNDDVRDW